MHSSSQRYISVLGTHPKLSHAELISMLPQHQIHIDRSLAMIVGDELNLPDLQKNLGGSVKLLRCIQQIEDTSDESLYQHIFDHLATEKKVTFGLAELGRDHLPMLNPMIVKKKLRSKGVSVRFIEGNRYGLSAAILCNEPSVREIAIVQFSGETWIAETITVQDINIWTTKDRHKPYADRKKGMLPPKVAAIMVNIGLGSTPSDHTVLLDPFCGSGTILMEALKRGVSVLGSDSDAVAVEGTKQNIDWFTKEFSINTHWKVMNADATHITANEKITHLITEPFLGKPKPSAAALANMFKGLEKLYLGAFKQWTKILAPHAKIVIVFPKVSKTEEHGAFTLEKIVDKIRDLGYTMTSEPITYARPDAVTERELHFFTYEPKN